MSKNNYDVERFYSFMELLLYLSDIHEKFPDYIVKLPDGFMTTNDPIYDVELDHDLNEIRLY
jgi:hypothetical protein